MNSTQAVIKALFFLFGLVPATHAVPDPDQASKYPDVDHWSNTVQANSFERSQKANLPDSLDSPVILPNGEEFRSWHSSSIFTRTYYVNNSHPNASDDNPGSTEKPLRTINQAARLVRPGERVVVAAGVYRECIQPHRGGTGPDKMISYEAAPGARVVVKGSIVLKSNWELSGLNGTVSSPNLWMIPLVDAYFNSYNPFLIENASKEDFTLMPWAEYHAGSLPYTLSRGLVFQDGRRLIQVGKRDDLLVLAGSYWVDKANRKLYVRTYENIDPDKGVFEITTQQHVLRPAVTDLGYIRIKGFIFEHVGNGFPRTGEGSVFTMGGHNWIFEDNTIRNVNSVGMEIGARTDESKKGRIVDSKRARENPGNVIVRRNQIYECGTGGIQGLQVRRALIEDNHIYCCGWQDVEWYSETGAIKLLEANSTLVRRNYVHDTIGAPGIWLDFLIVNSRITQNMIVNTNGFHGAIAMEASQVPNTVDHNFIWSSHGPGIWQADCDELLIAHNMIGKCSEAAVKMFIYSGRRVGGRLTTTKRNRIFNNVFIDNREPIECSDAENNSDYNLFGDSSDTFELEQWHKKTGWDTHSTKAKVHAELSKETGQLTWHINGRIPECKRVLGLDYDFWNRERQGDTITPGLFQRAPLEPTRISFLHTVPTFKTSLELRDSLYMVVSAGDILGLEQFLSKDVDVDVRRDWSLMTVLHRAAADGREDLVELLLANGADVNAKDTYGQAPLDIALIRNRKDIAKLLMEKGAVISSICVAAKVGDLSRVRALLEQGSDVNARDDSHRTPLHSTVNADIAELLIAKGADVNIEDKRGETPLHSAAEKGRKKVGELLLDHGSDINARDRWDYTPLYYAIWNEDANMVKFLVNRGADVNVLPKGDGSPLEYAVWNEDVEMAKLFVARGAKFDAKDHDGWTAFRYAVSGANREMLEFFVSKGADVSSIHGAACVGDLPRVKDFIQQGTDLDTKDEMDWTPLYWAASMGQQDVAEFLTAKGADVGAKAEDQSTPLHQGARAGAIRLVKLLIDKGADVNVQDKRGNTPLHAAASKDQPQVAELLIDKGADVNAKATNRWAPLHNAARQGHKDVVELLLNKGADVDAEDNRGRTPLNWAKQRGYKEIVELLKKCEAKEK